jgi:hypothetical protein
LNPHFKRFRLEPGDCFRRGRTARAGDGFGQDLLNSVEIEEGLICFLPLYVRFTDVISILQR